MSETAIGDTLDRAIEAAQLLLMQATQGDDDAAEALWLQLLVDCMAFRLGAPDAAGFVKLLNDKLTKDELPYRLAPPRPPPARAG